MILACALSFLAGGVVVALLAKSLGIVHIEPHYTGRTIVVKPTAPVDFDAPTPKRDWRHEIADCIAGPISAPRARRRAFEAAERVMERLKRPT